MAEGEAEVHKGLDGVVADETAISEVMPETDELTYHGYPVEELADRCSFEEVAYLLWHGELPDRSALEELTGIERAERALSDELAAVLGRVPDGAHPMDVLRTGISWLGLEDRSAAEPGSAPSVEQAQRVLARAPTILALAQRRSAGEEPVAPRDDLGFAANLLHMCFGEQAPAAVVEALDASLILYADHGFNASTFAARTVISTESDLYSAVVAAIGALKGPLHGGANEAVMEMLEEIESADEARGWVEDALAEGRKISGFGHRVYREGDSRVPTMRRQLAAVAEHGGGDELIERVDAVEQAMRDEKGIFPNVDFPAGPAYHLMGFPTQLFTPIFVVARMAGWTAHILEQAADNRLVRPLARYAGPEQRTVLELDER
jgi:2-methylcitrate synthase/citrate synthase II